MAIEVFNRYEKKYLIDEVTFKSLLNRISDYMELDKYNKNGQFYSISNIYYNDNIDLNVSAIYTKDNFERFSWIITILRVSIQ